MTAFAALVTRRYGFRQTSPVTRALLAAVALTVTGSLLMGSLVFDPGSRVLGGFNDAALGVRSYDVIDQAGETPFTYERDVLNGAPEGVPAVPATQYAAPVQPAVIWLLKGQLGHIGAMNAFLLSGLLLTGVAMFLLLDRLRFGFLPSLVGAYLVTFNPWMYERVLSGHAAFMHGWVLILLVAALYRLRRIRTLPNAALAGVAYGLCFLFASYTGLLATAVVVAFAIIDVVSGRDWVDRLWTGTLLLVITSVLGIFLLPGLVALVIEREAVTGTLTRSAEQIERLSAQPINYVLPSPRHPLIGDLADRLRPEDIFNEKVVFFGYSTLVLALGAVMHLCTRGRRMRIPSDQRRLLVLAAAAGGIGLVLSFGRKLDFGRVDIPMPGYLISEVTTFYRVYARLGFVVVIAAAILAAWLLAHLSRRRHGVIIVAALSALIVFETLPGRASALRIDTPPTHDAWLARQEPGIVAHYPMMTDRVPAEQLAARELYYQRFTGLPHFEIYSIQRRGTREDAIRLLARYVTDPKSPGVLAAEGVRYVVIHEDVYRAQGEPVPKLGRQFDLLREFDGVRIYELRARPADLDRLLEQNAAVIGSLFGIETPNLRLGAGFHGGERYLDYSGDWRWMAQSGKLIVENPNGKPTRVRIEGLSFSNKIERRVDLVDEDQRVLATTTVPASMVALRLGPLVLPPGTSRLSLLTTPGPAPLGDGQRTGSIYLSPLSFRPLADYSTSLRDT